MTARLAFLLLVAACNANEPRSRPHPLVLEPRPAPPAGIARDSIVMDVGHTCAIEATAKVACWGWNAFHLDTTPVEVADLDDVVGLAAGPNTTCAWTAHGTVTCWDWRAARYTPRLDDIVQVSVGSDSACALHETGRISCWKDTNPPRVIDGVTDAVEIAGAFGVGAEQLCARTKSGQVTCGNQVSRFAAIPALAGATSLSGTGSRFAVLLPEHADDRPGHRLATWVGWTGRPMPAFLDGIDGERVIVAGHLNGAAELCVLGTSSTCASWASEPSLEIAAPRPLPAGVRDLATDIDATCARIGDGVACWGRVGFLGNGEREYPGAFVPVPGIADARQLEAVGRTTCALRGNGHVACWGEHLLGDDEDAATRAPAIDREPVELPGVTDAVEIAMQGDDRGDGTIGIAVAVCARRARGATCWTSHAGRLQASDAPELAPAAKLYSGPAICGADAHGAVGCIRFGQNRGFIPGFAEDDYERFVHTAPASAAGSRVAHELAARLQRALKAHRIPDGFHESGSWDGGGEVSDAFHPPEPGPREGVVERRRFTWWPDSNPNDLRGVVCDRHDSGIVACWGERDYLGAGDHATREDPVKVAGLVMGPRRPRAIAAHAAPAEVPAVAPTCVRAGSTSSQTRIVDGAVIACYEMPQQGVDGDDCWRFDLATRAWSFATRQPHADASAPPPQVEATTTEATVCKRDGSDCKVVPLPHLAITRDDRIEGATNADRSIVAVWASGPVYVYDATGRRLSQIAPWTTPMSSSVETAHVLGDVIEVQVADTPVSVAIRLYDARTGKKIAGVMTGASMDRDFEPVALGGTRYAFLTFDSGGIVVVDVATGRQLAYYALPGLRLPSATLEHVGGALVGVAANCTRANQAASVAPPALLRRPPRAP
ncbi:MAG TPA: RCC1 domain-containing protein [Kofleriaceae bacterium]|nr:RCC1 domain-containing protein [Kofleriaceae bacterium]